MEKECLELLLKGKQPVVWCLAKRININGIRNQYLLPIKEGRLLILSPFEDKVVRPTKETALLRNDVVAALAASVFISFAAPCGKTEAFSRKVIDWGKEVITFDDQDNSFLISIGAKPIKQVIAISS